MENTIQINEAIVKDICYENFKRYPTVIERFQTGNCHFVYKITYPTCTYVLRISGEENKALLQASLYWLDKLCVYDMPVPKILIDGTSSIYPYIFLTYTEGADLGDVYTQLSDDEKHEIIRRLIGIQKSMEKLPKHRGFGYLLSYEDENYKNSWKEVIIEHLDRSRSRICENGIFDPKMINSVEQLLPKYDTYFDAIEPIPFLDDITTKNVLIHNGKLSGLIDIDGVCFGDKLYVVALTNMALIDKGFDMNYIDYWIEELDITPEQRHILDLYTLIFCLDFMSEKGMQFNKAESTQTSDEEILKLQNIFSHLYRKVVTHHGHV